jgi:hypothetical protein
MLISNGRRIDPVIFRMSTDELHQHTLVPIGNMNDEPVSVSAEIENGPVATKSTVDPNSALTSAGLTQAARATRAYQGLCLGGADPRIDAEFEAR